MIVADETISLEVSGNGDVLESHDGVIAVGSGSGYALGNTPCTETNLIHCVFSAAARALYHIPEFTARDIAERSMKVAAGNSI